MTSLRALIVDDEPLSRRAMRQLLDAHGDITVIAECDDAESAEPWLAQTDVCFLDVLMPRRSGLDLARSRESAGPPFVVFVTAYDEYAVPAFETEAVDYLSKPVAPDRLAKAIARVRERLRTVERATSSGLAQLVSRVGERDIIIPVADIDCIEADGVYVSVRVGDRRYLVRHSLDALEHELPADRFLRVHRSWIVAREHIAMIRGKRRAGQREIVTRAGSVIPVSRRRQSQVMRSISEGAARIGAR
jgi:two-component system, LytTR family, response regulator